MAERPFKKLFEQIFKNNAFNLKILFSIICCVVFVLCFVIFSKSATNDKENLFQELQTVSQAIRKNYQKNADYRGLNTQTVIKEKILPSFMLRQNKIFSRLKREIVIGRDDKGSPLLPLDHFFTVSYINVDKKMCLKLISQDFKINDGLLSIKLSTDIDTYEFTYGGILALPVLDDVAKQYCHTKNTLSFVFE